MKRSINRSAAIASKSATTAAIIANAEGVYHTSGTMKAMISIPILISPTWGKRRTLSRENFCQQTVLDNCSSGVDYNDTVSGGTTDGV